MTDPSGTVAVYSSTVAIVAVAVISGAAAALAASADAARAGLMATAVVLIALAGVTVVMAANPFRAPFTARAHLLVHTASLAAFAVAAWASWEAQEFTWRDNWVLVSIGILTIAVCPYRPVRELVAAGTLLGVITASVVYLKAQLVDDEPALAIAVGAFISIVAFSYGAAAYSAGTLRSIERRRRRIDNAADALAREMREGVARSVQQDRLTILERDVAPFFAAVLDKPTLDADDRSRAREIADSIRSVMVAESDRTWLDAMLGTVAGERRATRVVDPEGLASAIDTPGRTALRTLVQAVADDPDTDRLIVTLARDGEECAGVLTAVVNAPENSVRAAFGPYFAVMRAAFPTALLEFDQPHLIVRFSYERP